MSSGTGKNFRVQIFGESHGPLVGVTLDGLPAGLALDMDKVNAFLRRRAAAGELATGRRESDQPRIVSGLYAGRTTGYSLTAVFENANVRSGDYDFLPDKPRPGHADYPAMVKSAGFDDLRGSGHHSGRLTLPYAFAGAVAMELLSRFGVRIYAHLLSVGEARDTAIDPCKPEEEALRKAQARPIPTLDEQAGEAVAQAVRQAKNAGDSLGGVVECVALGVPPGLGDPFFDGVEAAAANQFFSIPGVKGVAFGAGFEAAVMKGSQYNDPYRLAEGRVVTLSNHAGGLLGGMSNGMPILARVAFRPTGSIALPQRTLSLGGGMEATLEVKGRHDPCVAIRAVPVVESGLAVALCELWLQRHGNGPLTEEKA